jgi:membrane fusion protein (multidrug efflux system)
MKHILHISLAIFILVASCGKKNTLETKRTQLDELLSKQQELASQIAQLQEEIATIDTVGMAANRKAKLVAIVELQTSLFEHSIDINGQIDADENVTYSAKVPAIVSRILVKSGDKVAKGQLLAELDNKAIKAQLDAMKQNYELVKILFDKQKELWEQQVGSEIQYLQAKNNKESMEKQIASLQESIDMYTIRADFAGIVDYLHIKVGQNVAPGVPCLRIVNNSSLRVKANVSESYASNVKRGDKVRLFFPDLNETIETKISHVSMAIDAVTRTFNVEVELPANNPQYRPNMVAQLGIVDYTKADALVIPINAIQRLDDEDIVFIAEQQTNGWVARKKRVKVKEVYAGRAEIADGLELLDKVIVLGFQDLIDSQPISF